MAYTPKKTRSQVSAEIMAEITDKFVKCLNEGKIPWHATWNCTDSGFLNSSGHSYSFMNTLLLALGGCTQGEFVTMNGVMERLGVTKKDDAFWAAFKKDSNGHIVKGHHVYFYTYVEYTKKDEYGKPLLDEDGEEIKGHYPMLKASVVWQVGKEVNVPLKFAHKVKEKVNNPIAECEKIKLNYQARENIEIREMKCTPAYNLTGDYIHIPSIGDYISARAYYSDLFHEIAHSTGAPKRMNREMSTLGMSKTSYSYEELVAEISSTAILHDMGINTEDTDRNSVAYIQSWAKALKNDPTMVEKACRMARKVADYIYNGKETDV